MTIDTTQLVADMKSAATQAIGSDVSTIRGFAERQLQAIAQQAEFVATGIATKQISPDLQEFFLDGLKDMARNFVKTLNGLVMVTVEKAWNAVVGVIWNAISKAANIVLPAPVLSS